MEEEEADRSVAKMSMDYFSMNAHDENANENPMMLMADQSNGQKYMRAVPMEGLGEGSEMSGLISRRRDIRR